jgi:maltooligosyltrehalose trehalohydrolase
VAPAASRVDVMLESDGRTAPMTPGARGYHRAVVEGVRPGDRDRLQMDGGESLPDPASPHQANGVRGALGHVRSFALYTKDVRPDA